ncbi:MAG: glycosyltransferase [Candidatus Marinimicrobia bacterium]|nr:glycosyltransferase [Candidatus Neomarinimicrobiota bacterium]
MLEGFKRFEERLKAGNPAGGGTALDILTRAEEFLRKRDYESALVVLEDFYRFNGGDLHMNLLLGEIHLEIGQDRESLNYFNKALQLEPGNSQALYGTGRVFYLRGDLNKSAEFIRRAIDEGLNKPEVYNDLGIVYSQAGKFFQAEQCFKKAMELKPDFGHAVVNLSSLYINVDRYDEALKLIDDYARDRDLPIDLLFNRGLALELKGMFDRAVKEFEGILARQRGNFNALYHKGYCYLNMGEIHKARECFQRCLKMDPDNEKLHTFMALTYAIEGKITEAIDIWKEFLPMFKSVQKKDVRVTPTKISPIKIVDSLESTQTKRDEKIDISVVIPVMNEEGSLFLLYNKLKRVLERLKKSHEIIFVDDGSTDNSLKIMDELARKDPSVVIIKFRKNYGQTAAFAAGFKYASGDVVITMDADLQNDPEDIPMLLKKLSEGYDLVSGWRKSRKDKTLTRKIPSYFANRIINKLIAGTGVRIHDFGCSLKAYKKGIVKNLKLYGEMHRFIPAYAAWLGIKIAEIPVKHHPRRFGHTKYGLGRVGTVLLDLITLRFYTGFRSRPLQFFGKVAFAATFLAMLVSSLLFFSKFLFGWGVSFETFLLMVMFSILGGMQFIVVGLIGEIVMRGFLEAQGKADYVVESVISYQNDR